MKNSSPKPLSITVGITTCFGAESILATVKSIRGSEGVNKFRFIIVADSVPIKTAIKKSLRQYQVELIENKTPGSQIKKQHQIIKMCRTDLIVLTQDDVLFAADTLKKIISAFARDPKTTFITIVNEPLKPKSLMEQAISVGTQISQRIAHHWRGGDNYLAVIGRVEAFRTDFVQHFHFHNQVVSTDAFFYLENKHRGGQYQYLRDARVYFRNPDNLAEHLKKSSRFQHSQLEMSRYFSDIDGEYQMPKLALIKGLAEQLILSPINTLLYLAVFIYTRLLKQKNKTALNPLWEAEISTKKI